MEMISTEEDNCMDDATRNVIENANAHRNKHPTLRTLLAEIAELAYALDGEHQHTPEEELIQIGGIAINWLRRMYTAQLEDR